MDAMNLERAFEIVSIVNDMAFYSMGLWDEGKPVRGLANISLGEMLEAKRLVEEGNAAPAAEGSRTIHVVPDDRLIAAAYALFHYEPNGDAILIMPARSAFFETDHVAIACVRLNRQSGEEEE